MTPKEKRNERLAAQMVKSLNRRNMEAFYCPTAADAVRKVSELVEDGNTVTWGGSMTIRDLGIPEMLKSRGTLEVLDRDLIDGDTIPLGGETIQVLHVPGHSPGGLAFYLPQSALLISGDTIFNGSVGRTDLWGGDMAQLINSIREKILPLPDETVIASGHGPTTTIADEKRCNPFL